MSGKILLSAAILFAGIFTASAQSTGSGGTYGTNTPYSVFGVGDIAAKGGAYNKSMGGVGIASRNNRFINPLNPASITARDSLAVMADFSLNLNNTFFSQGDSKSVSNIFNIGDFMLTLPIYRSSALILGIMPYSNTGYAMSYPCTEPIIGYTGNITDTYSGKGGLYQIFGGAGVTLFKNLSLGAEFIYYFGSVEKDYSKTFSSAEYLSNYYDYTLYLNGCTGKFGLQYEQPIGKDWKIGVGATYTMSTKLGGTIAKTVYSAESDDSVNTTIDTLNLHNPRLTLASEIGVGLSVNYKDKVRAEINYTRSDWSKCGFQNVPGLMVNTISGSSFSPAVSQSIRAGVEITPNRNDIRYYMKRVSYRAGAYWNQEYYSIAGTPIASMGITLGATLPVFRWYNGVSLGVDFGQRGSMKNNLIKERYINVSVGFNLFDIWFQKQKYQ